MTWMDFVNRAMQVHEKEAKIRAARLGIEQLQKTTQEFTDLVSEAASRLPARGAVCKIIADALEGEDAIASEFILRVLRQRKQFPKVYLKALVRSGIALGYKGASRIETASRAYGPRAVVGVVLEVATQVGIDETIARFLMSQMKPAEWQEGQKEEADDVRSLMHQVIDVIRAGGREGG